MHDVHLPQKLIKATDNEQFEFATKQLWNAIQKDRKLASKFNKKQLEQIRNGYKPSGYTWHHHQSTGKLQLVETKVHQATGHTGGKTIWGGGGAYR